MKKIISIPGIVGQHNFDISKDGNTIFVRDTAGSVAVLDLISELAEKNIQVTDPWQDFQCYN